MAALVLSARDVQALFLCLLGALTGAPARGQERAWVFGPFQKPSDGNPVITPSRTSQFVSSMSDTSVAWEAYATFNPAAVVRDGRVYLLYRAEDASGEARIGGHTSRIGLAESADGLRFTRRAAPVLYPDRDPQTKFEWPGGVEDPRIVETDDSTYVLTYTQWNPDIPPPPAPTSPPPIPSPQHAPPFPHTP